MRVEWQVEIDKYCQRVLAKHWPAVTRYSDVRSVDWASVEPVDVLAGGFPCQDVSLAGKGGGLAGARSGLWCEYQKAIDTIKPKYVLIENVAALRSRGLDQVLWALATLGYDAEWHCIPASAVGAPHQRDRLWVLAWRSEGWRCPAYESSNSSRGEIGDNAHLSDTNGIGQQEQWESFTHDQRGKLGWVRVEYSTWWSSEPAICRVVDGFPGRVDQLKGLGNAIVPQIAEMFGWIIIEKYYEQPS